MRADMNAYIMIYIPYSVHFLSFYKIKMDKSWQPMMHLRWCCIVLNILIGLLNFRLERNSINDYHIKSGILRLIVGGQTGVPSQPSARLAAPVVVFLLPHMIAAAAQS